jgi:DNA-binding transcriptional regulator YiaG
MKTAERDAARRLRCEEGRSIREIAHLVGVAKSSVSRWVSDIELSPAQHEALYDRNRLYHVQQRAHAARIRRARELRQLSQKEGRVLATREHVIHVAGCMLYWAEGARARNVVCFTNSDPAMVAFFVRFLRESFDVTDEAFAVTCNLFADHLARQHEIERFWLDTLGLPRTCLRKSTINRYSKYSQKKRRNKLPYGTCRVRVHQTAIVQSIYGSIQEYSGVERPEWLDC